ncbi:MAG: DUF721 domain-containing protein [Phreatobacter sp.]|uniref:DUF721 domain-containing protein n=1 Tax=Phreatobacter sp. TaxID=1966341 RepID=UPI001A4D889D|nr:DciA family protein [Phreatobacter sp.]MBL8570603.1 DUF721 domain-containing protein [Phreatobacter sp.]
MSSQTFRPRGPRPLADIAAAPIAGALRQAGFAATEVVTRWDEIVGEDLARRSAPVKIAWPRRPQGRDAGEQEPGTLHIRVETPFALDIQHLSATIVERVNAFFGWRCVANVRLSQAPLAPRKPKPARPAPPDEARLAKAIETVEDEALRRSLDRLGRAIGRAPAGTR